MVNTIIEFLTNFAGVFKIILGVLVAAGVISFMGVTFIPNNKVGIVEKLLSGKEKNGGIIAMNGEAGFQAKVLRGGWYFRFRFFYKVHKMDLITVPAGQIAYVYARDGQLMPGDQILGRQVECSGYEDVAAFIKNGGQRGPQRVILNAGTYAINLAQFVVLCEDGIHAMSLGTDNESEIIKNIDHTIRERDGYRPVIISGDQCGIVTVHDGPSLPAGELVADRVENHNSYQRAQDFLDNGGTKGIQLDPITNGTYFINALFATVEIIDKTEIPIGMVGVVNYFTGEEGEDLSGVEYNHGELVRNGQKGVWIKPLEPNKYAWNIYAGKIYDVPTTNFVLKWQRSSHNDLGYDDKLEEVSLITKDAFQPALPLSVVIHIDYTDAPKVIQRFGDIKTLISETIDPMVGAYFKNVGQTKTLLELIQDRSEIQQLAKEEMKSKFAEYNLNLVEVLIGTPKSVDGDKSIDDIYQSLKDRQMAREKAITLTEQTKTEQQRKVYQQAQKAAEMQSQLTESAAKIEITENEGKAKVAEATQAAIVLEKDANAAALKKKIDADADATATKTIADATRYKKEAEAIGDAAQVRELGKAKADAIAREGIALGIKTKEQTNAIGKQNQAQIQMITEISDAISKYPGDLVPRTVISMGANGDKDGNAGNVLLNLLNILLTQKIDPEAFESQDEDLSPEAQEVAKKLHDEILATATADQTVEVESDADEFEEEIGEEEYDTEEDMES